MFVLAYSKIKGGQPRYSLANTLNMGRDVQKGVNYWWIPKKDCGRGGVCSFNKQFNVKKWERMKERGK